MASIIKRKKNYSIVYTYVDENGETKQKWETWHTHKEALKRKAEIENQQHTGTFLPPSNQTITEFLYDFVSLYGEKKWGVSMYDSQTVLIANYINPIIGDMEVQAVTPRAVDGYIQTLQKTKSVSTKTRKAVTTYVSDKTIEKIIKLLRCAFKQAVRWEIIARNPFDNVILPKTEYAKRDIWTADMIRLALDKCTDSKLYVAMNLSFACSLRMGEILGLTWENVHISDEDIAADNAYVYIDKELTRASKRAIETLGEKDMKAFDPNYKLLDEMYQDDYYPAFLVDKVKDELQKVIALLESGETDTEVVQETLDEAVCGINDLQEEFDENDSEIETVARECIAATVAYILEWFGIPIDTEEAIRERDW